MIGVLANTTVVIILQYINVANPHVSTLNINTVKCQLYLKINFFKILMYSGVVRSEAQGLRWGEADSEDSMRYGYKTSIGSQVCDISSEEI